MSIFFSRELLSAISLAPLLIAFVFYLGQTTSKLILYKHINMRNLGLFIALGLLLIRLLIDLCAVSPRLPISFIITSTIQIAIPIVLIYVFNNSSLKDLFKLNALTDRLLTWYLLFGLIELCLPTDYKASLITTIQTKINGLSVVPESYRVGTGLFYLPILRLGSLFFEPLTFGFISAIMAVYLFEKQRNYISKLQFGYFLTTIFSFGKLSVFSLFASYTAILINKYLYRILIFSFGALLVVLLISNSDSLKLNNPSMYNHIAGLKHGLISSFENPILGHGLGTSGYLISLKCETYPELCPLFDDASKNGNESAIGIITYQLGIPFALIYIFIFIAISSTLFKLKHSFFGVLLICFVISFFLSESTLSILLLCVLLLKAFYLISSSVGTPKAITNE